MRRLRTRLAALENRGQDTLQPAAAELLASCYGRLHGLFMPARIKPTTWPAIRQARLGYLSGQLGIAAKGSGAGRWKAAHEAREQLVAMRLAVAVKGGSETTGLILTPLGRSIAYGLVCEIIPAVPIAEHFVEALRTAEADRIRGSEKWVSESRLFGIDCVGDSSRWQDFTDALLEPCVSGAVDSLCDVHGRAFYRFVRDYEPLPIAEGVEPSSRAGDAYVAAFVAEMERRHRIEDASGEIVIPLSVT